MTDVQEAPAPPKKHKSKGCYICGRRSGSPGMCRDCERAYQHHAKRVEAPEGLSNSERLTHMATAHEATLRWVAVRVRRFAKKPRGQQLSFGFAYDPDRLAHPIKGES